MKVLDARFVAMAKQAEELPVLPFAEVAFAGRSNAGKSSVINRLVGRKGLVRTSSTPGCTRGVALFEVRLAGATVVFVDLPGYGYAARSKSERRSWKPLVEGVITKRLGLRAVVLILDVRRELQAEEFQMLEFARAVDRPLLLVANKIDKLASSQRWPRIRKLQAQVDLPVVPFSAATGAGLLDLWSAVLSAAHIELDKEA